MKGKNLIFKKINPYPKDEKVKRLTRLILTRHIKLMRLAALKLLEINPDLHKVYEKFKSKKDMGRFVQTYYKNYADKDKEFSKLIKLYFDNRNKIVNLYQPLARRLAFLFSGNLSLIDDLKNEAILGIFSALDKIDPKKIDYFPKYMIWWMSYKIYSYLSRSMIISINRSFSIFYYKLKFRNMTDEEKSEYMRRCKLSQKCLDKAFKVLQSQDVSSKIDYDIAVEYNDHTFENVQHQNYISGIISKFLDKLPSEMSDLIKYRYGVGGYMMLNIESIAKMLNTSQSTTRRRIRQAQTYLRDMILAEGFLPEDLLDE